MAIVHDCSLRLLRLRVDGRLQRTIRIAFSAVLAGGAVTTRLLNVLFGAVPALVAFAFTLLSGGAWLAIDRRVARRGLRFPPERMRRLDRLCAHPEGPRRFPHRVLERALRNGESLLKATAIVAGASHCGTIIMVNDRPSASMGAEPGSPARFEPKRLEDWDDDDHLPELHELEKQIQELELSPDTPASEEDQKRLQEQLDRILAGRSRGESSRLRRFWSIWGIWILIAGFLLVVLTAAVIVIVSVVRKREFVEVGLVGLCVLGWLLARQFSRDTWWVIPGGLVLERHRVWRRRNRIFRFDPRSAVLVIGHNIRGKNKTIVADAGAAHALEMVPSDRLLAAWLSAAPPPTDEQLIDFFGGRGERPELLSGRST